MRAAALARRRPLDPDPLGDLRARPPSCTSASRPTARWTRCASGGITLVSLVATTLARLLDAGLERPPALRCALTGGGPVPPALRERALGGACRSALTYGLTETCSQVDDAAGGRAWTIRRTRAGPPLFCTRLRIAADGEILVAGPTVAPSAALRRRLARDRRPRPSRRAGLAAGARAQGGHDRHRRRERRAGRGRGGARGAPARARGGRRRARRTRNGARWWRPGSWPRPGARIDWDELLAHCRAHLAPYKVPKEFDRTERAAAADRLGQAAAQGAGMSAFDAEAHRAEQPQNWEDGLGGLDPQRASSCARGARPSPTG